MPPGVGSYRRPLPRRLAPWTRLRAWLAGVDAIELHARRVVHRGRYTAFKSGWKGLFAIACGAMYSATQIAQVKRSNYILDNINLNRHRFYDRDFVPGYASEAPDSVYDSLQAYNSVDPVSGLRMNADNHLVSSEPRAVRAARLRKAPISTDMMQDAAQLLQRMQKEIRVVYKSQPALPSQRMALAENEQQQQINSQVEAKSIAPSTHLSSTTPLTPQSAVHELPLDVLNNKDDDNLTRTRDPDTSPTRTSNVDVTSYLNASAPLPPPPHAPLGTADSKACVWTIPVRDVRPAARKAVPPSFDDANIAKTGDQSKPSIPPRPHVVTRTPHAARTRVPSSRAAAASSIAVQLQREEADDAFAQPQGGPAPPPRPVTEGRNGGNVTRPSPVAGSRTPCGAETEQGEESIEGIAYTPTLSVAERVERLRRVTEERLQRRYEAWRERQNIPGRPKTLVRAKYGRLHAITSTASSTSPSANEGAVLRITNHEEVD